MHDGNEFYLKGTNGKGCLITHGLTSSTQEIEDLALFLNKKGYDVLAPLLPGHNTNYKDLSKIKYKDWTKYISQKYNELSKNVNSINLIGLSVGGTLSLNLATEKPANSIIALAPAIEYVSNQTKIIWFGKYFLKYKKKDYSKHFPNREESVADVYDDDAFNKRIAYKIASVSAIHESLKLISNLKKKLQKISIPTLLIHSHKDHTIKYNSSKIIFDKINSKNKKLIPLTKSGHLITVDIEKDIVFNEILKFITENE